CSVASRRSSRRPPCSPSGRSLFANVQVTPCCSCAPWCRQRWGSSRSSASRGPSPPCGWRSCCAVATRCSGCTDEGPPRRCRATRDHYAGTTADSQSSRPHVVVVGGGFGGIGTVRKLARANVDITLIDRHTYNTFQPLLYQFATASLNP